MNEYSYLSTVILTTAGFVTSKTQSKNGQLLTNQPLGKLINQSTISNYITGMSSQVHFSRPSQFVALLEIENPPANTVSSRMKKTLDKHLREMAKDPLLRALVLTGRGGRFCAGDDLKEAIARAGNVQESIDNLKQFSTIFEKLEDLSFPSIAAIDGWCIGGGLELALCCDIRLCSDSAQFRGAGVNVGLTASGFRLPAIIGKGRAKHMLLSGLTIDSKTALNYGLVTGVYDSKRLIDEALALAEVISTKAPMAVSATKAIIEASENPQIPDVREFARLEIMKLAKSKDHQLALDAFKKKQTPIFNGN